MIKIKHLLILCSLIIAGCVSHASNQGTILHASGTEVTENRKVANFSGIDVSNAIEVIYTVGSKNDLTVSAPKDIISYVVTEVKHGTLYCKIKTGDNKSINLGNKKIIVRLTAPALNEFDISGASTINVTNAITGIPKLEIELSGASKMDISKIDVSELEVELSGASNLDIASVTTTRADLEVSGASHLAIDQIKAKKMSIDGNGASNGTISGKADICKIEISGTSSFDLSNLIFKNGDVEVSGVSKLTLNKNSGIDSMETSGNSSVKKK